MAGLFDNWGMANTGQGVLPDWLYQTLAQNPDVLLQGLKALTAPQLRTMEQRPTDTMQLRTMAGGPPGDSAAPPSAQPAVPGGYTPPQPSQFDYEPRKSIFDRPDSIPGDRMDGAPPPAAGYGRAPMAMAQGGGFSAPAPQQSPSIVPSLFGGGSSAAPQQTQMAQSSIGGPPQPPQGLGAFGLLLGKYGRAMEEQQQRDYERRKQQYVYNVTDQFLVKHGITDPLTRQMVLSTPQVAAQMGVIGKPETTDDIKEWREAMKNPAFREYMLEMKKAGRSETNVNIAGEKKFDQEVAVGDAKRVNEVMTKAEASAGNLQKLQITKNLLGLMETGKLAPAFATMGAWAQAVGVDPAKIGIDPKLPATAEAVTSLISRGLVDMIGSGGFPAQNFSNADRLFLVQTLPSVTNRPEANAIIIEAQTRVEKRNIEKAEAWAAVREANPDENQVKLFNRFESEWRKKATTENIFDDLQTKIQDVAKAPVRVNSPEEARKLPSGTRIILPDGREGKVP